MRIDLVGDEFLEGTADVVVVGSKQHFFLFVIPGHREAMSPESIPLRCLWPDGFSGAQLRTIARAAHAPE
jgi:hypothetical protein